MSLACETGRHKVSLESRPFGEGKEKGPREYSQQMCPYFPESIRILCRCTIKPRTWRLHNYKDHTSIAHRVSLYGLSLKQVKLGWPAATTVVAECLGSYMWNRRQKVRISLYTLIFYPS